VFYALAAYAAARAWLSEPPRWPRGATVALLALVSTAWAVRDAGLHFKLRHSAFLARSEWAETLKPNERQDWPTDPRQLAVVSRIKSEAVSVQAPPPAQMPDWGESWWGEE
jgi:hypothetical protein